MTDGVHILVRTDIDWNTMTMAEFSNQTDKDRPLLFIKYALHYNVFDVWDQVYSMPYFRFRAELARIARDNTDSVRQGSVTRGLKGFDDWYADTAGDEWFFPIDDDDYFDPALVDCVAGVPSDIGVVTWPEFSYYAAGPRAHGPYASGTGQPTVSATPHQVLWTNNWGMRRSFLQRHFTKRQARQMITDHRYASQQVGALVGCHFPPEPTPWYEFTLSGSPIRVLDRPFSLTLKHPASLFFLWNILDKEDPVGELRSRAFGTAADVPDALAWATPWIREVESLLAGIVIR